MSLQTNSMNLQNHFRNTSDGQAKNAKTSEKLCSEVIKNCKTDLHLKPKCPCKRMNVTSLLVL